MRSRPFLTCKRQQRSIPTRSIRTGSWPMHRPSWDAQKMLAGSFRKQNAFGLMEAQDLARKPKALRKKSDLSLANSEGLSLRQRQGPLARNELRYSRRTVPNTWGRLSLVGRGVSDQFRAGPVGVAMMPGAAYLPVFVPAGSISRCTAVDS